MFPFLLKTLSPFLSFTFFATTAFGSPFRLILTVPNLKVQKELLTYKVECQVTKVGKSFLKSFIYLLRKCHGITSLPRVRMSCKKNDFIITIELYMNISVEII